MGDLLGDRRGCDRRGWGGRCDVNRINVVPEPEPALRKTGVYPMTGPYRANCVCSGALYTTTPSGALVPAWTLNTGTATSSAGSPPASISTPSTPGGHWARKCRARRDGRAGLLTRGVRRNLQGIAHGCEAAGDVRDGALLARAGRRMGRGASAGRLGRTRWCTATVPRLSRMTTPSPGRFTIRLLGELGGDQRRSGCCCSAPAAAMSAMRPPSRRTGPAAGSRAR